MQNKANITTLLLHYKKLLDAHLELTNDNQALVKIINQLRDILSKEANDLREGVPLNLQERDKIAEVQQTYQSHHTVIKRIKETKQHLQRHAHHIELRIHTLESHSKGLEKDIEHFAAMEEQTPVELTPHQTRREHDFLLELDATGRELTELNYYLPQLMHSLYQNIPQDELAPSETLSEAFQDVMEMEATLCAQFSLILRQFHGEFEDKPEPEPQPSFYPELGMKPPRKDIENEQ